MNQRDPTLSVPTSYRPTAQEVDGLLQRAADHHLGTDFLVNGSLDSVAATFGVHAFTVDAARTACRKRAEQRAATART
jgi:hypothetical protein